MEGRWYRTDLVEPGKKVEEDLRPAHAQVAPSHREALAVAEQDSEERAACDETLVDERAQPRVLVRPVRRRAATEVAAAEVGRSRTDLGQDGSAGWTR